MYFYNYIFLNTGTRSIVVVVLDPMRKLNVIIYLMFTSAVFLVVYSASNRNEYWKEKKNVSGV
jgi:hypothetical protein